MNASLASRSLIVTVVLSLTVTIKEPVVAVIVSSVVVRVLITSSSSLTLPLVKYALPDSVSMVKAFCALKFLSFTVKLSMPTVVTVVSRVVEKILYAELRRTAARLLILPPSTLLST